MWCISIEFYNLNLYMADLRLTTNAQPQPLYTSVKYLCFYVQSTQWPRLCVFFQHRQPTHSQVPIQLPSRLGSQEVTYTNAGISPNTNPQPTTINTGARLTGTGTIPTNPNVTNVPYGVTSAYSSSYKSGGYASGYNPNLNSKTPVHFTSNSNYYAPPANV